jgi:MFS family permease
VARQERTRLSLWLRSAAVDLRSYPRQFWILVGGTLLYCGVAALAFPFEGVYLRTELGASMTAIGVVFGLVPLALLPLQFLAGRIADRTGRRPLIIVASFAGVIWFAGFAYAQEVWQVAVLVGIDVAVGWPLFQTASNAMIADLVEPERRAEAFSVSRVAMNVGVVLGPAVAGIALGLGASFFELFMAAAGGCLLCAVLAVVWIRETRPASAAAEVAHVDDAGRSGFAIVRADRRFLVFCAVALLPIFCFGTFGSIYPVFVTDQLGVAAGTWGMLLALNAAIVATVQYPLVRVTSRRTDPFVLLAVSSALVAVGIGAAAFVTPLWPLIALVVIMSLGESLLSPITAMVVSDLAPEEVRGRYMGVWTFVWSGGACLGPLVVGFVMDQAGAHAAFATVLAVGLLGAALFLLLRRSMPRARTTVHLAPPA